jgi:hypothetical protein
VKRSIAWPPLFQFIQVDTLAICEGIRDSKYFPFAKKSAIAKEHITPKNCKTFRHKDCELILTSGSKCSACKKLAQNLWKMTKSSNSIFINIKHLRTPQKRNRITRLKLEKYRISKRLHRLQIKAMDMTEHGGCTDTTINADMAIIMEELNTNISKDSLGDFERIFWEQQLKAAQVKGPSGMRWHPLMIRWAVGLKSLSTSAYEAMGQVIKLPSARTLRDYTHWYKAEPGRWHAVHYILS